MKYHINYFSVAMLSLHAQFKSILLRVSLAVIKTESLDDTQLEIMVIWMIFGFVSSPDFMKLKFRLWKFGYLKLFFFKTEFHLIPTSLILVIVCYPNFNFFLSYIFLIIKHYKDIWNNCWDEGKIIFNKNNEFIEYFQF